MSEKFHDKLNGQLCEYLETYTENLAHSVVIAGGTQGSLEVLGLLCDEGVSSVIYAGSTVKSVILNKHPLKLSGRRPSIRIRSSLSARRPPGPR